MHAFVPQPALFWCRSIAPALAARRQKPGVSQHGQDGLWGTEGETPSFLYAMPLGGNRVFLEETCLVARPALPFATLKRRLERRCRALGIKVSCRAGGGQGSRGVEGCAGFLLCIRVERPRSLPRLALGAGPAALALSRACVTVLARCPGACQASRLIGQRF